MDFRYLCMEDIQLKRSPSIVNPLHALQSECILPLRVCASNYYLPLDLLLENERLSDLNVRRMRTRRLLLAGRCDYCRCHN